MKKLSGLEPENVFGYFEDICLIPHGSGNTKQISDYCVKFAKEHGLVFFQDELNNIIIRKPASAGYETHPAVILQGHLDMVCEKLPECSIDFAKDPLKLAVNGDFVYAEQTSLGGDDGIAVAMILAVLADKTALHPEIEAVFTVDEETGMYGAKALDTSVLKGHTLINIDSEQTGILTAGCAGGARADLSMPLKTEKISAQCFEITVSGLAGGHSGTEINKGRMNANKVMGDFLSTVNAPLNIISISGGNKDNAIPRECRCTLSADADLSLLAEKYAKMHRGPEEPDLKIEVNPLPCVFEGFSCASSIKIINLICDLPFGVIKMSEDIEGLVQTSLNIGILKTENKTLCASFSVRSSSEREKKELLARLSGIIGEYGGKFSSHSSYPAWEYRKNSRLRRIMTETYYDMFGKEPKTEIIHAGLECGIFAEKISDFDAVSIGPDLYDIHTPRERLCVSSAKATYTYLCEVLKRL